MEMNPDNPVVRLCSDGMQAEFEGRTDDARALYTQAWETSTDDYEASIAAHFLARHQSTPEATLQWNCEALNRANAVGNERVRGFYPSLYLNIGHSFEVLGDRAQAKHYYDRAADKLADLPEGPYGDVVRNGVARARQRIELREEEPGTEEFREK